MRTFVDTNILAYAYDRKAGEKHSQAKELVTELWRSKTRPIISGQVIQELHATLNKFGYPAREAVEITQRFLVWEVITVTPDLLRDSFGFRLDHQLSVWDSTIVAAATRGGLRPASYRRPPARTMVRLLPGIGSFEVISYVACPLDRAP